MQLGDDPELDASVRGRSCESTTPVRRVQHVREAAGEKFLQHVACVANRTFLKPQIMANHRDLSVWHSAAREPSLAEPSAAFTCPPHGITSAGGHQCPSQKLPDGETTRGHPKMTSTRRSVT